MKLKKKIQNIKQVDKDSEWKQLHNNLWFFFRWRHYSSKLRLTHRTSIVFRRVVDCVCQQHWKSNIKKLKVFFIFLVYSMLAWGKIKCGIAEKELKFAQLITAATRGQMRTEQKKPKQKKWKENTEFVWKWQSVINDGIRCSYQFNG